MNLKNLLFQRVYVCALLYTVMTHEAEKMRLLLQNKWETWDKIISFEALFVGKLILEIHCICMGSYA